MRLMIVALSVAVSACSLTPDPVTPDLPVPRHYPTPTREDQARENAADLDWRFMFGDLRLQRIIELALTNNRDLRLAALNVEAVQAQYSIQRAARLPAVSATGGLNRQRLAADPKADPATAARTQTQHTLDIGISSFEIDLFGRARSLSEAAFARYLASEEGYLAAEITLVSAVADAYFAERLAQEQLDLATQTLTDWRHSLDLAHRLKAANQSSALDVAQAEGQVATAEADLEGRARMLARAGNALRLLVGAELPDDLPPAGGLDGKAVKTRLPPGLPSDLLVRRPDIRQAERNLIAANAHIGAARAAFFPRLSLTSSLGYASPGLSNLFDGTQRVWSFAPQISLPLFMGGQLEAELRLAEIRKSEAVAEYERVIQTAFREVADGLAGSATYDHQIEAQDRAVAAAEQRVALSTLRYRAGLEGRLEVLDAQRQLYAARQIRLDLKRDEIGNAISLYKALGGGSASAAE
ncbi:efflux transporter outer membrane subunit [Novispirillum itersonii]|uniref:efflux transporter outer membrane subunit n=1 Tax=Novispirillum itersonii TaxID=189 RepID=UPI00037EC747|nr:efflux transporter outer membrane subunit [Novispirillum itersonii]